MRIVENTVVTFHYTLKNENGEVMDASNEQRGPLSILQGHGNIILGLEEELYGKIAGEQFDVKVEPLKGYGEFNEELVHEVPLSGFRAEGDEQLVVGMQVQVETNQGPAVAVVHNIEGETVSLDLNHPLAGETLFFNINIVKVREADADEIAHGHVHGMDGVQH